MSVFKKNCFFFLRNPAGGVEDLGAMQAAGFTGVFCNIGDHRPEEWSTIRGRAGARGMFCGPWIRCETGGAFDPTKLEFLIEVAEVWDRAPYIVNVEAELKGTGGEITSYIAEGCAGHDAAISMEPIPFDNVSWVPVADMPMLPQFFSAIFDRHSIDWATSQWHAYGVKCVFPTFGTYGGSHPADYKLIHPYSLYTADDCGGNYAAWSPTGFGYEGCVDTNGGEDDVEMIGEDDGVVAEYNALRDLDPTRTLLQKTPDGKWPSLSTLQEAGIPVKNWKAWDKAQRRAQILVDDHDEQAAKEQT